MKITKYLSAGVGLSFFVTAAHAATFTAASFTFEQDNTPDQLELIGDGATLGGAVFSAGTATRTTGTAPFRPTLPGSMHLCRSGGRALPRLG